MATPLAEPGCPVLYLPPEARGKAPSGSASDTSTQLWAFEKNTAGDATSSRLSQDALAFLLRFEAGTLFPKSIVWGPPIWDPR